MQNNDLFLLMLHAECLPVKGHKNSIICDLNRKKIYPITNDLFDILSNNEGKDKAQIYSYYDEDDKTTLTEYFKYLEDLECIHWVHPSLYNSFPKLNLNWDYPSLISNAIIDLSEEVMRKLEIIFHSLNQLGCKYVQLRNFKKLKPVSIFEKVKELTLVSNFRGIDIITNYDEESVELVNNQSNERILSIVFYSAPFDDVPKRENSTTQIAFVKQSILSESFCGQIHSSYFNTNITLFTEAQQHNTCLNRKISIDVNGEIKNCPSMAKSYGNIKDTTLAEAIEKPGFKDLWFINKDKIHVCKDCEFRYICTDCRAYIENPEDIYSKPLKCGYNPYTAEWEEWSTNPLKQKAIEYYGMQELVKKEK